MLFPRRTNREGWARERQGKNKQIEPERYRESPCPQPRDIREKKHLASVRPRSISWSHQESPASARRTSACAQVDVRYLAAIDAGQYTKNKRSHSSSGAVKAWASTLSLARHAAQDSVSGNRRCSVDRRALIRRQTLQRFAMGKSRAKSSADDQ